MRCSAVRCGTDLARAPPRSPLARTGQLGATGKEEDGTDEQDRNHHLGRGLRHGRASGGGMPGLDETPHPVTRSASGRRLFRRGPRGAPPPPPAPPRGGGGGGGRPPHRDTSQQNKEQSNKKRG